MPVEAKKGARVLFKVPDVWGAGVEYLDGTVIEVSPDRKFVKVLVADLRGMPKKWISATALRETLREPKPEG